MSDHAEKADEVERELDDLQHESERLEGDIAEAKDDWERKKRDDAVPGASGPTADDDAAGSEG